ncbi:MAG: TetR/AcrR family transcriptional regulator [Syntrophomonadaceae bacterium]|nr:TetR/AcrR family transcriptional regulator [Syntrophomonadaceae bacterium]
MNRKSHELTTKDRIIKATLDIINGEGFQNVTIRKIAAIAGVNVAAVNYHFGSKDAVINQALNTITLRIVEAFACLKSDELGPSVRLESFIRQYSKVTMEYPDIIRNFISQSLHNNMVRSEYQEYLRKEGITLVAGTIAEIRPDESETVHYLRTLQLLSSLSFPILMGERVAEITGLDLNDPDLSDRYIELLVNNITGGARAASG